MKKIVIASGKGGVGKSMLSSSMAMLFAKEQKTVACDCDVDASNLGLWLGVQKYDSTHKISTSEKATISQDACLKCGKCASTCVFEAIEKKNENYYISPFSCEGCGACELVCPANAITLTRVKNGAIKTKKTPYNFILISGELFPGETGSGDVVDRTREEAEKYECETMILDSAAGIGCPVIASVRGCDYALLITEPSPASFSDLKRVLEIVNHFNVDYGIVINQWELNPELTDIISKWAGERLLGKISYDKKVVDSITKLKPVLESDSKVVKELESIFKNLKQRI
ncbi:MAG: ATP-binding protein [Candidatus Diapherotrites archaeon]|nr:ATP-binding protein [Candidatus Diapherotrites archaeon]